MIEVPNDLGAMVDAAKVADLVLLMIDGSFGFEMVSFPGSHFGKLRPFLHLLVYRKPSKHSQHSHLMVYPRSSLF